MLRLLIVALPLVVALLAAFDNQETNAIQFEVQSTLQLEVRSPPESRPLLLAATHSTPHAQHPIAHIKMHPAGKTINRARARRSTPRSTSSPISSSPGTPTHHPQVCPPALLAATHAARAAFGRPCRCARDRCTCCRCTRARTRRSLPRASPDCVPAERPAGLRARRISPSARASERAASPVLLTPCTLLPRWRCSQPQLRAVGLDGHRALDISATISRCDVDITVTRTWQQSRPRALPHGPGGAKPVPVKPVPVSRARPCRRTARPAHHRVRPVNSVLVIGAMTATASTTAASTPAPPLGTGPPHHRLPHDASPHSLV